MLTKSQTSLHWREWAKVKKTLIANGYSTEEADAERHIIYQEACGKKSIKDLDRRKDFDMVLAHFKALTDPTNLDAQIHAENGKRDRSKWSILEAAKTLGENYISKVSEERFKTRDWQALNDRQIAQLAMTLNNRLRTREKAKA